MDLLIRAMDLLRRAMDLFIKVMDLLIAVMDILIKVKDLTIRVMELLDITSAALWRRPGTPGGSQEEPGAQLGTPGGHLGGSLLSADVGLCSTFLLLFYVSHQR